MVGQTIAPCKILQKLGGGGMGVEYKAQDFTRNRIVAITILNREAAFDSDLQKRFLNEASADAGLIYFI